MQIVYWFSVTKHVYICNNCTPKNHNNKNADECFKHIIVIRSHVTTISAAPLGLYRNKTKKANETKKQKGFRLAVLFRFHSCVIGLCAVLWHRVGRQIFAYATHDTRIEIHSYL